MPPAQPARPAAWLPDPLDNALVRYWDGHRWTFHTAVPRTVVPVEVRPRDQAPPAVPALRPDVAQALESSSKPNGSMSRWTRIRWCRCRCGCRSRCWTGCPRRPASSTPSRPS
ncbi:MAG TPA: DUF2510 domain-containing protein [Pseudonocardiaceae bacterium]|nr:DUF2510 domain-containing protein [Pseudonocardiaceae bacterium]